MAIIITDDKKLREFIPNVFSDVDDELSLYQKILPFINLSESWLIENITGNELLLKIASDNTDLRYYNVATIIVSRAFVQAIPSLDIVLTPNGFGIVSNNNIAPASKERIDRLMKSLFKISSDCLAELLPMLRADSDWHNTKQCTWLAGSIVQDLKMVHFCRGEKTSLGNPDVDCWTAFLELRQRTYNIEQQIANEWISPQLMSRLRKKEATASCDDAERLLIDAIKGCVCDAVRLHRINKKILADAVTYIRNHPDLFPEWHASPTSELFSPPIFENAKKSAGYFF